MKYSRLLIGVLSVAVCGALSGSLPSFATAEDSDLNGATGGAEARATASSTTCKKTFTTGSGASFFSWCYSPTGNIVRLSYPAGLEHVAVGTVHEGYLLCVGNTVEAWDFVSTDGGFGPATNGFNSVTRSAARLKLQQNYSTDAKRHSAKVLMKVTNISGIDLSDVRVARFVDFDVDGALSNRWDRSSRAVWASSTDGASLDATTFTVPATSVVTSSASPSCAPTGTPVPTTGDFASQVTYSLGAIAKGASKTVEIQYSQH